MKRNGGSSLLELVQDFFANHLRRIRGASEHTVRAYRDGLRQFFSFLANHLKRGVTDLSLDDIRAESVLAFLHHIESVRGNGVVTRNCRLAAVRSFVAHLLRRDITRAQEYGRILSLPAKRATHSAISYLEPEDVNAIIAAIEGSGAAARRDRALVLLLYNTGGRVSEVLAIRRGDLQTGPPRQVRLRGKGGKERICPLWAETAAALQLLPVDAGSEGQVFRNTQGSPLTRDGVAYILAKYVSRAAHARPGLRRRHITPHVLRHSCAVALLQAGVDVCVIRDYLGHASITTTSRYLASNLQMKREVLEAFWKRAGLDRRTADRWRPSPKLLAFLDSL
jgi:site-specific recombinase XerD